MDYDMKLRKHILGVSSTEKRELEGYLSEVPLSEKKLTDFATKFILPDTYRTLVWNILLGITPKYAESHEFVCQQHKYVFNELWRTLKVLRLRRPFPQDNEPGASGCIGPGSCTAYADNQNPEPEHYFLMWMIGETKNLDDPKALIYDTENQQYIAIARRLSSFFDHPSDFFSFYAALWGRLKKNRDILIGAAEKTIISLRHKDDILHLHLRKINLLSSNILQNLCLSLFCDIFPESAVLILLDKVIAGVFDIVAVVLDSLLSYLRSNLISAKTVEGIKNIFYQLRKEQAEHVVYKALNHWHVNELKRN